MVRFVGVEFKNIPLIPKNKSLSNWANGLVFGLLLAKQSHYKPFSKPWDEGKPSEECQQRGTCVSQWTIWHKGEKPVKEHRYGRFPSEMVGVKMWAMEGQS